MRRLAHKPVALAWRQRRSHAPYGAPAAATSSCRTFMNKPYPFPSSYPTFFLLNLTHTTVSEAVCSTLLRPWSGAVRASHYSSFQSSTKVKVCAYAPVGHRKNWQGICGGWAGR